MISSYVLDEVLELDGAAPARGGGVFGHHAFRLVSRQRDAWSGKAMQQQ